MDKPYKVVCSPGDLDDVKTKHSGFSHFTIGKGKTMYHYFTLAESSCGIYYAWRITDDGFAAFRRAVEPTQDIVCYFNQQKE